MCTTQNANVAIIGAGFAGLSAFQHLQDAGITADLFEASDRLGGRVFPLKFGISYNPYVPHIPLCVRHLKTLIYRGRISSTWR